MFINTSTISGNTFEKLIRVVAIMEDSLWLGYGEGVMGDLLFTLNTFVTF